MLDPEYKRLYQRAMHAEAAFHEELVRQFGLKAAADMRYHACKHDKETALAREAKKAAYAELREFMDNLDKDKE